MMLSLQFPLAAFLSKETKQNVEVVASLLKGL